MSTNAEIAKEMRELGYACTARTVEKVARHDPDAIVGPLPGNAALAANILAALDARAD